MRPIRTLAIGIVLLLGTGAAWAQVPLLVPGSISRLEDLQGKIFMLRGFFGGPTVHYDSSGTVLQAGRPEAWTLAGIKVGEVRREGETLEIRGTRVGFLWDGAKFAPFDRQLRDAKKKPMPERVTILVDLLRPDDAAAVTMVGRIFLTTDDGLEDLVPDYWRQYVARFSPAGATPTSNADKVPISKPEQMGAGAPATGEPQAAVHKMGEVGSPVPAAPPANVLKVGAGVSPPQLRHNPDPLYVEAARLARIQGTSVLWIIVGNDGSVRNVRVARAIGFGLDDNAVAAVKDWQFAPAMKDGQPVTVQVSIEVNFRLY